MEKTFHYHDNQVKKLLRTPALFRDRALDTIPLDKNQYVKFEKRHITFRIYDAEQNEGLSYNREGPLITTFRIAKIKKMKVSHQYIKIVAEDVEILEFRNDNIHFNKSQCEFKVYRIFENDSELIKDLQEYAKKSLNKIIVFMLCIATLVGCAPEKLKGVEGTWFLDNNSVMVIKEKEFYWYKSNKDANDNYYYSNNIELLSGEAALNAIKVPQSNKEELLKTHTYYLGVVYSEFYADGKDLSSQLDKKNEFALQLTSNKSMEIVNLDTNESFTARRGE